VTEYIMLTRIMVVLLVVVGKDQLSRRGGVSLIAVGIVCTEPRRSMEISLDGRVRHPPRDQDARSP
jgi:hypothetical protein